MPEVVVSSLITQKFSWMESPWKVHSATPPPSGDNAIIHVQ